MTTESDEEFKKKMDALSMRLAKTLDGEDALDVITVMAGLIAFGLTEQYANVMDRMAALERLVDFMRSQAMQHRAP